MRLVHEFKIETKRKNLEQHLAPSLADAVDWTLVFGFVAVEVRPSGVDSR